MSVMSQIPLEWADKELQNNIAFQEAAGRKLTREQYEAYTAGWHSAIARLATEICRLERIAK